MNCLVEQQLPILTIIAAFICYSYKVMEDVNATLTLNQLCIFNETKKLNGVEFHGNKLIAEESKTPSRTIYSNNNLIKSSHLL